MLATVLNNCTKKIEDHQSQQRDVDQGLSELENKRDIGFTIVPLF